jgi:hypothetical protein
MELAARTEHQPYEATPARRGLRRLRSGQGVAAKGWFSAAADKDVAE